MGLANQQVIVSLGFQSLSSTYTVLRSTGVMNAAMDKNNHITWRTTTAVLEGERPETKYKWWNNSQPSVHNKAVSHSGQQMNMSVAAMMMVVMVAMLYHTAQSVSHPNNQLTRHPTIQPSSHPFKDPILSCLPEETLRISKQYTIYCVNKQFTVFIVHAFLLLLLPLLLLPPQFHLKFSTFKST